MSVPAAAGEAPLPAAGWDERWMEAALSLGRRNLGQTFPNPAVGALVVREDGSEPVVVGRGFTARGGRPHAETEALRRAGAEGRGATIYVSLEPCAHHSKTPPCADAIVASRVRRAVVALEDPNPKVRGQGLARLRAAGVVVTLGVGAEKARITHAGHFRRIFDGRPQTILKMAVSADGKTAFAGRRPAPISGEASLAEAHMLRATSDAILVGSGTVLSDDPQLTCRLPGMGNRSPIRVILDGALRTPLASKLVSTAHAVPVWIVAREDAPHEAERALADRGVTVLRGPVRGGKLDLEAALRLLAARDITRVLIEGGSVLSSSLVQTDLVDEAIIVRSPKRLGEDAVDALDGMPLTALTESKAFRVIDQRVLGPDSLTHYFRN